MQATCNTTHYNYLVNKIKTGTKISSCLDHDKRRDVWFTGSVYRIYAGGDYSEMHIKRDDGMTGGGINGTWSINISPYNCLFIKIIDEDWDD
jgi:hypothetical protein